MTQLTMAGVHKAFGDHTVLTGLDLEVPAGSLTAILGPSGSGKTTLLRVLAGFERADCGTVTIGGCLVDSPGAHVPPERRRIGYVPQEGSLFPHLTVAANVGFGLRARQRRGPAIAELLEAVGLAGLGDRYPHQLSGGQQQRVALARALAIRPQVVLLDEPFGSLDAHLRASVRADVARLLAETHTTGVLVTHDQDEALSTADRVAVLRDGRIAQCAPPQELYDRPADADIARFIGDANLIEGMLDDGTVDTILGRLRVEPPVPAPPAPAQALVPVPTPAPSPVPVPTPAPSPVPVAGSARRPVPAAGPAPAPGLSPKPGQDPAPAEAGLGSAAAKHGPSPAEHGPDPAGHAPDPAGHGPAAACRQSGRATVLVRPEQVELLTDGIGQPPTSGHLPGTSAGPELPGHVVAYGYHGHDAVIHVRPDPDADAPLIIVRTVGGPQLPLGSSVRLRARGPVLAWPHG
jgi:iron(III) transport system ATP-binding protein